MAASLLPEHLVHGLAAVAAQPRPLRELATARQALCDDLSALPADVAYVATHGKARALDRLPELPNLTALWASGVTPALVTALSGLTSLRALHLYQIGRTDLARLGALPALEHLLVGWAPHLTDLAWVPQYPRLATLSITDAKRLDFATLPVLPRLRALDVQGGMTTTLVVPSYAPALRAPSLEFLAFANVRAADGELQCLGSLSHLKELQVPNFYPADQSARLAARLPRTDGRILRPVYSEPAFDTAGNPLFPCLTCGGAKLMLTGKPSRLLCPTCDHARIAQAVSSWEIMRAAVSAT